MKEGEGELFKLQKLLGILKWDKIPAKLLTHSHTHTHTYTLTNTRTWIQILHVQRKQVSIGRINKQHVKKVYTNCNANLLCPSKTTQFSKYIELWVGLWILLTIHCY